MGKDIYTSKFVVRTSLYSSVVGIQYGIDGNNTPYAMITANKEMAVQQYRFEAKTPSELGEQIEYVYRADDKVSQFLQLSIGYRKFGEIKEKLVSILETKFVQTKGEK